MVVAIIFSPTVAHIKCQGAQLNKQWENTLNLTNYPLLFLNILGFPFNLSFTMTFSLLHALSFFPFFPHILIIYSLWFIFHCFQH